MAIDLAHRRELSGQEKYEISVMMHYALLEEIFRHSGWQKGRAVFHGGTSLKVNWRSPRFSEDLDFMITPEEMPNLDEIIRASKEGMAARLMADLPNSQFGIKKNISEDQAIVRYGIRWTHPKRIGRVLVKMEFFKAPEYQLARYPACISIPDPDSETRVAISTPIIVAELESILSDKLVALAKRPYHKIRDIFDLWYVSGRLKEMGVTIDMEALAERTEQTASIYDYDRQVLVDGLKKRLSEFHELAQENELAEEVARDLGRWLPAPLHEGYGMSGTYEAMIDKTCGMMGELADTLEQQQMDFGGGMRL